MASPKEHLYQSKWHLIQHNFTERNIQKVNPYLLHFCPEQNSLVMYQALPRFAHRVWLVNTLTLLAPIGSPIICTWVPSKICEQWERNLTTYFSRCSWGRNVWQTPKNVCWEAKDLVVTYGRWSLTRINPQVVSNEKRSTVWKRILLIFGYDRKFFIYSEWCSVVHTANIEITSCV